MVCGAKMNLIKLKGYIKDASFSHEISNIRYGKANLIVPKQNEEEDILTLVYKEHINHYSNGDFIELKGNIRSFSRRLDSGKNKVDIYVFTYFDIPKFSDESQNNEVELDGRICKMGELRDYVNGTKSLSFTLANNIFLENNKKKINNYLPVVCWEQNAEEISNLNVGDKIKIKGKLHSRTYKKYVDNNLEFKTAHEIVLEEFEKVE